MEDKPKKVQKNLLFLNAVKDLQKNQPRPVLVPPDLSQKDTINAENTSEKEIHAPRFPENFSPVVNHAEKDILSSEFPYGNISRKDIQSSEFPHKNSRTNFDKIDFKKRSFSVTDQLTDRSESISRSISCPTSNEKNYRAPSDKRGYTQPYQIKSQRDSSESSQRRNNFRYENRYKYYRSNSETDHNHRFSKSNDEALFRRKYGQSRPSASTSYHSNNLNSESGDNWCNLAEQESNVKDLTSRNKSRTDYQPKSLVSTASSCNNFKSENYLETLHTLANCIDSNLDVHGNKHDKKEQPKLFMPTSDRNNNFNSEIKDNWIDQEQNPQHLIQGKIEQLKSPVFTSNPSNLKSESFSETGSKLSALTSNHTNSFKDKSVLKTEHNCINQESAVQCMDYRNMYTKFEKTIVSPSANLKSRTVSETMNNCIDKESDAQHSAHRNTPSESPFNLNLKLKLSSVLPKLELPENFIPPPVLPASFIKDDVNQINSTCGAVLDQNGIFSSNINSNPAGNETNEKTYPPISDPDSKQLEAITNYILGIVKEKSASNSLADRVVRDLNVLFKNHLEGNVIDIYGSYDSNIAISTSDINLVMKADTTVRKGFMFEVYKVLCREQDKYNVHPFEEERSPSRTKILFSEPNSGVSCQLAYLGKCEESILKMGKFLRNICLYDSRVRALIIAAKIWAEICLINDVEEGKLHPVGFAILVIHFLQHYEKPILPIPIDFLSNNKLESPLLPTSSSVGELWVAFLKYFAVTFNWLDDVVTVTSKQTVSKKSKNWDKMWMAIEDPITGQNIAKNVISSDSAEFIKISFKSSYEYFCNSPRDSSSNSSDESNEESPFGKWQYSFDQCMAPQDDFFCEMCDELGETCDECRKKIYTPTLSSVPEMTEVFLKKIRKVLYSIYEKYMLTDDEVQERKEFVKKLQMDIRKISYGYKGAELNLFGSSINGFGFKHGDLDMCLTVETKKIGNSTTILKDLRTLLRRNKDFGFSIALFNATIQIVKFHYKPKDWRGDICINNTLAVYNSRLLHTYTLIDERCKILGCALRLLAQKALISDVKALSSYSYSIMVIHFLQQTDPPVLPVLQDPKFHENDYKLTDIVENCNTWFYKDIDKLKLPTNNTPVEQLWLDLLDYYCTYDHSRFITIQQKEPLLLSEKQISARLFNIQDPFIREKNLGRVVSHRMAQETEKLLLRARILFRTPKEFPPGIKDIEDYFFSTMSLTGRIHKEAHCGLCGKYGHEKIECKQLCFPMWRHPRFTNRYYHGKSTSTFKIPINRH